MALSGIAPIVTGGTKWLNCAVQWRQGNGGRWKAPFAFGIAFVAVVLVYWLTDILLLCFVALLLGILLDSIASPGIRFLHWRRGVAVVLVVVLFVVAVLAGLALLIVPLARQATEFVHEAPKWVAGIERQAEKDRQEFPWLNRFFPEQGSEPTAGGSSIKAPELARRAALTASAILDGAATVWEFSSGIVFSLGSRTLVAWNGGTLAGR